MRPILLIFLLLFWQGLIAQSNRTNLIKDSTYVFIELDSSLNCYHKLASYTGWKIDPENLGSLDSIISTILIERVNAGTPFQCGIELHDYQYFFQIVPIEDPNGRKLLWINAFNPSIIRYITPKRKPRKDFEQFDWNSQIVCGHDGCGSFWEFKLDLETKSYFDLGISGV